MDGWIGMGDWWRLRCCGCIISFLLFCRDAAVAKQIEKRNSLRQKKSFQNQSQSSPVVAKGSTLWCTLCSSLILHGRAKALVKTLCP
uniref:Putative secreted protein n=1 Tax=Anopheles marajoara TaxID=58244 RepID=A0A2M4CAF0_9DIPT